MKKIIQLNFVLDNPSEIFKKHGLNDVPYAFIILTPNKEIEELDRCIFFSTKEDYNENKGCYCFVDEFMIDSLYEYTCSPIHNL